MPLNVSELGLSDELAPRPIQSISCNVCNGKKNFETVVGTMGHLPGTLGRLPGTLRHSGTFFEKAEEVPW